MKSRVIGVILIVIIGISILPWTHNIDTAINGIESRLGNSEQDKDIVININGIYKKYLFKENYFEGVIWISNYNNIWDKDRGRLVFEGNSARVGQMIINNEGGFDDYYFGELFINNNFEEVLFLVAEDSDGGKGWNGGDGLYITAPVKNKEESIELAKKLSKSSKWLSSGTLEWD